MSLRPSALPMLAQCPCFEGGEPQDFTLAGTARHTALSKVLTDAPDPLTGLDDDDAEGVVWAADQIRDRSFGGAFKCEVKHSLLDDDFQTVMEGTPDVTCGNILFDLKWRERDYRLQMAAYAAMMFQESGFAEVTVHILFGASKRVQTFIFKQDDALRLVLDIVARVKDSAAKPQPCDYCGWCARAATCPALIMRAKAIEAGREDWKPEQFHTSIPLSADEMGKMLRLARQVSKWCDAVEHHAKKSAQEGNVPTGFEVGTKAGRSFISGAAEAFALATLPQEEFLKACAVRLNSSKTYKDQVGLVELYAKFSGLKKAAAKRMLLEKLSPVIKTGNSSVVLRAVGQKEEEEE